MDNIHVVNKVIEKFAEYPKPLNMAFIDYGKAFVSVLTEAVPESLKYQGIEETYIRRVENIYRVF